MNLILTGLGVPRGCEGRFFDQLLVMYFGQLQLVEFIVTFF